MTGVNTASSREEKVVLPLELRTALLCWYPFRYGKRALYLGNDREAHVPVLRRWFEAVDESFNDACAYDFIMVHDWRGAENELEELLGKCSQLLSGNGVLLLGFRNRFGLKYLCGGLDDVVSHPFSSVGISKDADCDLFSRGEMEYLLDCSSFEHVRFYSICLISFQKSRIFPISAGFLLFEHKNESK